MSKFNVNDKVVLTEVGKDYIKECGHPLPTGVGTVVVPRNGSEFTGVDFPGLPNGFLFKDAELALYRMTDAATDEFKVGTTVGLTVKAADDLVREGYDLPAGWGKVVRLPAPLYYKVDFPGTGVNLFSGVDLKAGPVVEERPEPKFEEGDKVVLTYEARNELSRQGLRRVVGSKIKYRCWDEEGFWGYTLEREAYQNGTEVMWYNESELIAQPAPIRKDTPAPVVGDELIGKNVVLTLKAHKSFLEIAGVSATYGVVSAGRSGHYGIEFEGVRGKRWFTAEEFVVLPA